MLASLSGLFLFCQFYHSSLISFFLFLCFLVLFFPCISLSATHSDHHINVVCSELIKMLHLPLSPSSLGHFYRLPLYFYKWNGSVYSVQSCQMCWFQIKVIPEATHKSLNSPGVRAAETFLCGLSTLSVILLYYGLWNTCSLISRSPGFTIFLNPFLTLTETKLYPLDTHYSPSSYPVHSSTWLSCPTIFLSSSLISFLFFFLTYKYIRGICKCFVTISCFQIYTGFPFSGRHCISLRHWLLSFSKS